MKKSILTVIIALLTGVIALENNVSEKNIYKIDDFKNLRNFLLAKDTTNSSEKYDLNNDGKWNNFDSCLMKRDFIEQNSDKIEFGTQIKNDFIVDNVLHSKTQGDIHFSSYIPNEYDGSEPYALFITLPG